MPLDWTDDNENEFEEPIIIEYNPEPIPTCPLCGGPLIAVASVSGTATFLISSGSTVDFNAPFDFFGDVLVVAIQCSQCRHQPTSQEIETHPCVIGVNVTMNQPSKVSDDS